jgi:hypothetical protein
MSALISWIWLISVLGKGGHGGRRRSKRKVGGEKHCKCGNVMVRTTGSSGYRCQKCSPDLGEQIAKSVESLVGVCRKSPFVIFC